MLDWNKPLQTRGGDRVTFVGGPLPKAAVLKLVGGREFCGHETHVYEIEGKFFGTDADGSDYGVPSLESEMDIVNAPAPRTSEFRTFQPDPRANRNSLGNFRAKTLDELTPFLAHKDNLDRPMWAGIVEIVREGEQVVDVKFHSKAAE